MKELGILLILAGVVLGGFAYSMDTTVTTDSRNFGYGISIPSMTINNLGLMEERRNKLMIAGVLVLVGAIFTALSSKSESEKTSETDLNLVKCSFCAEMIKKEALICRFCGKDVPQMQSKADPDNPASLMKKYGITKEGDKYCFDVYHYDRLDDALNYAKLLESRNSG